MSRLICPICYTGKVSYQLAKLKSGSVVLDWKKCSTSGCTNNYYASDGIKGDKSALPNIDYYYKVNSGWDSDSLVLNFITKKLKNESI